MTVTTNILRLDLPAVAASVRAARTAVAKVMEPLSAPETVDDARLCVSEAVTNAVRHAYGAAESGRVELLVSRNDEELLVFVRDSGRGIVERNGPRTSGGYGLLLIERLTARHTLRTSDAGTEVEMAFELGPSQDTSGA